jgi:hypothetical protein
LKNLKQNFFKFVEYRQNYWKLENYTRNVLWFFSILISGRVCVTNINVWCLSEYRINLYYFFKMFINFELFCLCKFYQVLKIWSKNIGIFSITFWKFLIPTSCNYVVNIQNVFFLESPLFFIWCNVKKIHNEN